MRVPTVEELQERLAYNAETGVLSWKKARKKTVIGSPAKSLDIAGYIQVSLGVGCVHKGHRIAWAIHYGKWPVDQIDHINGVRNDNRIANLREVNHQTNCQNIRLGSKSNKSTGFLGVWRDAKREDGPKVYRAKIMFQGKQYHLGGFPSAEAAHQAYVKAKRKLHAGCAI